MGDTDLPTMLDYALKTNGANKLSYIGHSMGGTLICELLATKTEYNDKINVAALLAPVTLLPNWKSIMTSLNNPVILTFLKMVKHGEMPFFSEIFKNYFCQDTLMSKPCTLLYFALFGPSDELQYNKSRNDLLFTFYPESTSVKLAEHYLQIYTSNRFARFDYKGLNKRIYNQTSPPEFELSKVTAAMAIFWADNDWVVNQGDIEILEKSLSNVVLNFKVNYTGFSHMDLVTGNSAMELVYLPVIEAIKKYA